MLTILGTTLCSASDGCNGSDGLSRSSYICGKVDRSSLLVSSSSSSSYLGVWAFEALLHSVHVKITLQNSLLESIRLGPLRLPGLLLDGRSLSWRLRHLGNGLCPIVDGASWRRGGGEREGSARSTYDGTLGTRPKLLGPVETLLVWAQNIIVRWGSCMFGVACLWNRRSETWATSSRQSCRKACPLTRGAYERGFPPSWDGAPIMRSGRRGWAITISRAAIRTDVAHVGRTEAHPPDKWCSGCSLGVHVVIFDSALINGVRVVRVGRHASSTNERRCVCG
jgi:hypothetical protein